MTQRQEAGLQLGAVLWDVEGEAHMVGGQGAKSLQVTSGDVNLCADKLQPEAGPDRNFLAFVKARKFPQSLTISNGHICPAPEL